MRHAVGVAVHRRTWAGAAAGVVAGGTAGLLGVSLFAGSAPACALTPEAPTRGRASYYEITSGGGNCGYPAPPDDGLYVALGPAEYAGAHACGSHLRVTGPLGSVRVKVVDSCPGCARGELDLSRKAFARVAPLKKGLADISYQRVPDPPVPPLSFMVRKGSSAHWLSLSVLDHGNPLARVRARAPGRSWRTLVHTDYNAWQVPGGLGPGPFTVEVTDERGHRATATGIRLAIGVVQPTRVRLYPRESSASGRPAPSPADTSPAPADPPRRTASSGAPAPHVRSC